MLPFLIKHYKIDLKTNLKGLLLMVVFGNLIPAFLFTAAQKHLDSAVVGMLNSMVPVLTMIVGILVFGVRIWALQAIGLVVGLFGALMLILPQGLSGFRWQALLVVLASTCYAFNINIVKRYLQNLPSVLITAGAFLWVGPWCILYLFLTDFTYRVQMPGGAFAFGAIALLAIVGTAIALLLFNALIQRAGSLFASLVTYIVPIFAVMWGYFDGEQILTIQIIGVSVILLGVYLVSKMPKLDN
jgi:drug/metabolite transporter (DMT)-like permease